MNSPTTETVQDQFRKAFVRGYVINRALPGYTEQAQPKRLTRRESRYLRKKLLAHKCRAAGVKTAAGLQARAAAT